MSSEQYQQLNLDQLKDGKEENIYEDYEVASELTGTTTKTSAYTEGIHGELYIQARQLLHEYNHIICSGYGWQDNGMNNMLKEWAREHYRDKAKHLLLLHAPSCKHEFKSKNHLWFWPDDWDSKNREDWFQWYPKWLSKTDINTIDEIFWNN